ncbi:hypothetical protein D3C76_1349400 [compost metagenome]
MFERADCSVGGEHHLAYLQVPVAVLASLDLGSQRLSAELPGSLPGILFIGKDGEEVDGMNAREVESTFLHAAQNVDADIFREGLFHGTHLLS